jgi:eukaryotic-like serine/threonine-protein kinase
MYLREHHLKEASANFEAALKVTDKDYKIWGNLADSYQYAGDGVKAQKAFQRAVELADSAVKISPQDVAREAILAYYYAWVHLREKALTRIQSALAAGADPVLTLVASTYEVLGMRKQAIEFVNRALKSGYPMERLKHSYTLSALREDPAFRQTR